MNTYHSLPFPKNEEDAKANLQIIESMLEQNEKCDREEAARWAALSPDEKRDEMEKPELDAGFKKCPRCGMIPRVWRSQAEGFGFEPFIYCFDDESVAKANEVSPDCSNHRDNPELENKRFKTLNDLRDYWNGLLNVQ